MKKYIFVFTLTISSIILIGQNQSPIEKADADANISVNTSDDIPLYIAKDLDGYVAIYVPKEQTPYMVTDIDVLSLPAFDRENLQTGIPLDESYTLANFLEDFSS